MGQLNGHNLKTASLPGAKWYCKTCGQRWKVAPKRECPGALVLDYLGLCAAQDNPDLIADYGLERAGLKCAPGQSAVSVVFGGGGNIKSRFFRRSECEPLWAEGQPHTIQRGQHIVEFLESGGERCIRCERTYRTGGAWGDCAGVKQYDWEPWPDGLFTEKQIRAKGLRPGPVRGAVWYSKAVNHWLWLHRLDEANPPEKPRSEKQQAAMDRMQAANKLRRTCINCGGPADYPAKGGGRCRKCSIAEWAAAVLKESPVILDTETTGLGYEDEIIQIGIVDSAGRVLLDSCIKPVAAIDERGRAFEINGISNTMVAAAPDFKTIYPRILEAVAGKTIIAYNVAFDKMMVDAQIEKNDLPPLEADWTCAMEGFAEWYGERRRRGWRWQTLSMACHVLDVTIDAEAHTGAGDCLRTLEVVKRLAERWKGDHVDAAHSQ